MENLNFCTKTELRKRITEQRRLISAEDKRKADLNIFDCFKNSSAFADCETVLCYVSTPLEADTRAIIDLCFKSRKKLAVPLIREKGIMDFVFINSVDELKENSFGIMEPSQEGGEIYCHRSEILSDEKSKHHYRNKNGVLCVVPGLCFDLFGNRLGYGGGYFDRFLAGFIGTTIGICYDRFLFNKIPKERYDISVDYIISESGLKKTTGDRKYG